VENRQGAGKLLLPWNRLEAVQKEQVEANEIEEN
jgi:hypothetical protein